MPNDDENIKRFVLLYAENMQKKNLKDEYMG